MLGRITGPCDRSRPGKPARKRLGAPLHANLESIRLDSYQARLRRAANGYRLGGFSRCGVCSQNVYVATRAPIMAGALSIGTAGWAYKDWVGVFYPDYLTARKIHPLEYVARFFDVVEINTSFYGPIKPQLAKVWCRKVAEVNPNFQFTAKLYRSFTHSPLQSWSPRRLLRFALSEMTRIVRARASIRLRRRESSALCSSSFPFRTKIL